MNIFSDWRAAFVASIAMVWISSISNNDDVEFAAAITAFILMGLAAIFAIAKGQKE